MAIQLQYCPEHADEDIAGVRHPDGTYVFRCDQSGRHQKGRPIEWIHDPVLHETQGMGGLADELGLDVELVAALATLGTGWVEYGLVERAYAGAKPADFQTMVERWGHTARAPAQYTCSSYIAGVLGRLAKSGAVCLRTGVGTGRWNYNTDLSYWAIDPDAPWESRQTWVSVIGDDTAEAREADRECRRYVLGETT